MCALDILFANNRAWASQRVEVHGLVYDRRRRTFAARRRERQWDERYHASLQALK